MALFIQHPATDTAAAAAAAPAAADDDDDDDDDVTNISVQEQLQTTAQLGMYNQQSSYTTSQRLI